MTVKKHKHWSERLIAVLCMVAIVAIVVTDHGMELWAKAPPSWLYIGLAFVALGVSTEDMKDLLLSLVRTWVKANPENRKE